MKLFNFSKIINTGNNSQKLIKVKRVVCPDCMSAMVVTLNKRVQIIICDACGHKYEVKI